MGQQYQTESRVILMQVPAACNAQNMQEKS